MLTFMPPGQNCAPDAVPRLVSPSGADGNSLQRLGKVPHQGGVFTKDGTAGGIVGANGSRRHPMDRILSSLLLKPFIVVVPWYLLATFVYRKIILSIAKSHS